MTNSSVSLRVARITAVLAAAIAMLATQVLPAQAWSLFSDYDTPKAFFVSVGSSAKNKVWINVWADQDVKLHVELDGEPFTVIDVPHGETEALVVKIPALARGAHEVTTYAIDTDGDRSKTDVRTSVWAPLISLKPTETAPQATTPAPAGDLPIAWESDAVAMYNPTPCVFFSTAASGDITVYATYNGSTYNGKVASKPDQDGVRYGRLCFSSYPARTYTLDVWIENSNHQSSEHLTTSWYTLYE